MSKEEISKLPPSQTNLTNNQNLQPETKAIMKWVLENPFVLSLILHGGAVGAFYPFDDGKYKPAGTASKSGYVSETADNNVMKYLAKTYSSNHKDMHLGLPCKHPDAPDFTFENGFQNGAEWYPLSGSMNDFNYLFSNCFEVTVEVTCCKKPDASTLPSEWDKNFKSLVAYLKQAHIGVKGLVTDTKGNRVADAEIEVIGNEKKILASSRGEYWRLLLPGKYRIQAKGLCNSKHCKVSSVKDVTIKKGEITRLDLRLKKRNKGPPWI